MDEFDDAARKAIILVIDRYQDGDYVDIDGLQRYEGSRRIIDLAERIKFLLRNNRGYDITSTHVLYGRNEMRVLISVRRGQRLELRTYVVERRPPALGVLSSTGRNAVALEAS